MNKLFSIVFRRGHQLFRGLTAVVCSLFGSSCALSPGARIDWERSAALSAAAGTVSDDSWAADCDYLVKRLEKDHPNPWHAVAKADFETCLRAPLPPAASTEEVGELRAARLSRALALLGEGHTAARIQGALKRGLPIGFSRGGDGYYATSARFNPDTAGSEPASPRATGLESILGARLLSLAGIDIAELEKRLLPYASGENDGFRRAQLARFLPAAGILLDAGIIESGVSGVAATFRRSDESGADSDLTIDLNIDLNIDLEFEDLSASGGQWRDAFAALGTQAPESFGRSGEAYWWRVSSDPAVAYFAYNSCSRMKDRPFEAAVKEFFTEAAAKDAIAMILDLRGNDGGDSSIFTFGFLPALIRSPYQAKGKLFVLIDANVFSSGLFAVYELSRDAEPVFVGEATGQGINHYGYTGYAMLSATGFVVTYSTTYWELKKGDSAAAFLPDVFVPKDIPAILQGRDPVLEAAAALVKRAPNH